MIESEQKKSEESSIDKIETSSIVITDQYYKNCRENQYNLNDYVNLFKDIKGKNPLIQFKGLVGMRKLSNEEKKKNEPKKMFNVLINSLFNFITDYSEEFQYESLICLINLEKINIKLDEKIKGTPNDILLDNIISKITNAKNVKINLLNKFLKYTYIILNDGDILQKMISKNLIELITNILKDFNNDPNIIKNSLKILCKLYDNKIITNETINNSVNMVPLIDDIINKYQDQIKLLIHSLNLLYELTYKGTEIILNKIISLNMLQKIIQFIDHENEDIIFYSLKIVGNFAMKEDSFFTQKIIELNVLDGLKKTLNKEYKENIRIESSFTISNIAAGTQEQIMNLYQNNFDVLLIDIIENEEESKIKTNCLWALYNFSCIKNGQYLEDLIKKGLMRIIIGRFKKDEGDVLSCSLEALDNLFKYEKQIGNPAISNVIRNEMDNLDVYNELKNLKENIVDETGLKKLDALLINYFGE